MHDALRSDARGSSECLGPTSSRKRRRSVRRAVKLEVSLASNVWDGTVVLPATDISDEGLWVETSYALSEGEELVVSFELPDAPQVGRVWAVAEVARVGMWRRRNDERPSGMGLMFTYCGDDDALRLRVALQGRPPPLPLDAVRTALPPPLPLTSEQRIAAREVNDDALPAVLDWLLASE